MCMFCFYLGCEKAKSLLEDWGLRLEPAPLQLPGRSLQPEGILYGNNRRCPGNMQADWGRDCTSNRVISGVRNTHHFPDFF